MKKLQKLRLNRGLSQSQLATLVGISVRTLQAYEQGAKDIDSARLHTLIDLSIALNCNITEIIENDDLIAQCQVTNL